MGHQFEEALGSCQEPRLNQAHYDFISQRGMVGQTDTIMWGNPVFDLVTITDFKVIGFIMSKFYIAIIDHQVKTVNLCNHFDCLAYAKEGINFNGPKDEFSGRVCQDSKIGNLKWNF